ncbi:outer membrane beta-barrel protein [Silvibacterium sp.]|uniref:outer membrane beta-barrel protein n=1 Tax=Silvibacterium sp. TaxID=1964179 RepID=UPI0039E35FB0
MQTLRHVLKISSLLAAFCLVPFLSAQEAASPQTQQAPAGATEVQQLRETVKLLEQRVAALEAEMGHQAHTDSPAATAEANNLNAATKEISSPPPATTPAPAQPSAAAASILPTQLPGGATLGYDLDGYYEYDFNHPIGRVEYLRAYDVLSNAFSLNQAGVVFDLDPDVTNGRRYGARLDLQFGQATETLQGNPANEPRPEIYRNLFQAYGTYVAPIGSGLTVDFGKWASSLGVEGNYTKDQMNYTRSFFFYYLPFYHMGVRASYKLNNWLTANYWVVNGTNQTEPTNSFKDELFGFNIQPTKSVSWTINYYLGQDHADVTSSTGCTTPTQPGLCFTPIDPAPDGKLHIFDSYATWTASPRLTFSGEGDYVIEREWANAAPGESSAPSHVIGGAAYAHFQWTPRTALAARSEYLSDRGGLFSGTTQALKEVTGTYEYKLADNMLARFEYRRDWTNVPFFLTNKTGLLSDHQTTATLGLVWWYGGRQGAW